MTYYIYYIALEKYFTTNLLTQVKTNIIDNFIK